MPLSGVMHFRNPSPDELWLTPYVFVTTAGAAFYAALESYRNKSEPAKRLTRFERIGLKTSGALVVSIGLTFLIFACRLVRDQWISVTRWPRAVSGSAGVMRKRCGPLSNPLNPGTSRELATIRKILAASKLFSATVGTRLKSKFSESRSAYLSSPATCTTIGDHPDSRTLSAAV